MNGDMSYDRDAISNRDRDLGPDATYDRDQGDLGDRGTQDQGRGTMDKVSGKVQEGWGKLTGDKGDEMEGKMKQGKGSIEQGLGQGESDIDSTLS